MFRLLKLAAYCALGYVIYEFYRGLTEPRAPRISAQRRDLREALNKEQGRMGVLSGGGGGQVVRSEDPHGGSTPHTIGRGVISS